MKKSVIAALALSLFLMAGAASASVIGIFGDNGATTCAKAFNTPYTSVVVYFCALLDDTDAISAAEFGATGLVVPNTPSHIISVTWDTNLVIGNILEPQGVALAFPVPKAAPLAVLGNMSTFLMAPYPQNHVMQITPSGAGNLVIVDAATQTARYPEGWRLIVNCVIGGDYGECLCEATIATEDAAWGQIKALY